MLSSWYINFGPKLFACKTNRTTHSIEVWDILDAKNSAVSGSPIYGITSSYPGTTAMNISQLGIDTDPPMSSGVST
jgi:hypothetical protein